MLSKKAYKYTDPNAYLRSNKTNEKANAYHPSTRNKRSSEVQQANKQDSLDPKIDRVNKSNENKSAEKQLYKMHYTPKLTSFMLADSNMVQKQEQNEEVSGKYYYKENNQESKYKKNQSLDRNHSIKSPQVTNFSNSFEQTQTLMAVSDNIRSFIQEFIFSIKDDQSMSLRLEQSVQNLLMRMLNVATLISGMANYYSHNSYQRTNYTEQQQRNDRVYKKSKQVNRKLPIQSIQQCIRIEDSLLSKYPYEQARSKYSQRELEMINNASRQLPILCQDPSAEDLLSSCRKQPFYQGHDEYVSKYDDNDASANMSEQSMNKSDKQQSQSNKSYGYSNFVDNLFTSQKHPKQKQPVQQNNSFLKNKYKFNHQYRQPPSYLADNHSDISKQESPSKQGQSSNQQSIISQSDVGVQEGAYSSSIHSCSLQARSNNYHSSYNFKKAKNNSHTKQSHEKYAQDKDQMMQNSISEYYIQQSPININKSSMSKNVSGIKSKHNHSPISYTYEQYSPIPKSQKNKSYSSSNILITNTNTNINKNNKYNKQNKSPFNCIQSSNKNLEGNADYKHVSPTNNFSSHYNSKQKSKRYSDIYINNRVSMGSINPTNATNNTNSSQSFNHLFGHKAPNPSSHVTTNTQGYIVSQVLSRRKIF